jgi:putative cell wall-binding protein
MRKFSAILGLAVLLAFHHGGPVRAAAPTVDASPQGSSAITVDWSSSSNYLLEVKVGGATIRSASGSSGSGTQLFSGLLPGTAYTVVLTSGEGQATDSVTTPSDAPSIPQNVKLTAVCLLTLRVEWDAPDDSGSSQISGYVVTYTVGDVTKQVTTTTPSVDLTGFASESSLVSVEVQARNEDLLLSNQTSAISKKPDNAAACPSSAVDSGSDSGDSGGSGGSGGGGGIAPNTDGEALPGVPKSLAGADRVATSIAVAEADFVPASTNPTAQSATLRAKAAVIASSTSFPDALAAGPLAYAKVAPLLLTGKNSLDSRVSSTLTKLVPAGSAVYIVGGEAAVSANVATAISNLGFTVQRIAGLDRYETSVKVAQALGNPTKAFAATGLDFPDALSAGVIAARQSGAILLTRGGEIPLVVAGYLLENPSTAVTAVGGPAATAFPAATNYKGADRYATAVALAEAFPPSSVTAGVASGRNFPDGLVAAPYLARRGGVLVLTQQLVVPSATSGYIKATTKIDVLQVFGGLSVVSDAARRTLATYL